MAALTADRSYRVRPVPVEFLTDAEAASYGRYNGPPPRAELERAFFLDDTDKVLVARRRGLGPCGTSEREVTLRPGRR